MPNFRLLTAAVEALPLTERYDDHGHCRSTSQIYWVGGEEEVEKEAYWSSLFDRCFCTCSMPPRLAWLTPRAEHFGVMLT